MQKNMWKKSKQLKIEKWMDNVSKTNKNNSNKNIKNNSNNKEGTLYYIYII